jgi:CspA family cold shock protein
MTAPSQLVSGENALTRQKFYQLVKKDVAGGFRTVAQRSGISPKTGITRKNSCKIKGPIHNRPCYIINDPLLLSAQSIDLMTTPDCRMMRAVNTKETTTMANGTVKWFNTTKGYGFIAPDDGGKDIFVHISAVERSGLTGLADNQKVTFDLESGRDGRESAVNIALA